MCTDACSRVCVIARGRAFATRLQAIRHTHKRTDTHKHLHTGCSQNAIIYRYIPPSLSLSPLPRFSASAAAELGQHLVEEHQSPLVNCMHTQSLVGHAQVDNTVLQAARNVAWRNTAVWFFARQFERVRLRDECFVAMLALMDRMTVLSTRQATQVGQCGTLTPRDEDESTCTQ